MMPPDSDMEDAGGGPPKVDPERASCTPCHGTGKVISNLGGEAHTVVCPWCEGSGKFTPEHDAQNAPHEQEPS